MLHVQASSDPPLQGLQKVCSENGRCAPSLSMLMLHMSWHMLLQLLKGMVILSMAGSSLCLDQQLCRIRKLQSLHHLCPKCNYWVSLFICKWLYCTKTGTSKYLQWRCLQLCQNILQAIFLCDLLLKEHDFDILYVKILYVSALTTILS